MALFFYTFFRGHEYTYLDEYKGGILVVKTSDLRQREVINVLDGKRLGFISDLDIDLEKGIIQSIIIPAQNKVFSLFTRSGDYVIPWEQIKKIGSDVILVELADFVNPVKPQ